MRDDTQARDRGAMRLVPYMGVIYVVAEAEKLGFYNGHPEWCNLGQGQPEVGEMAGAPARFDDFEVRPEDHAYGPVAGTIELRERVAEYYNRVYRQGKSSQYGAENVVIASGGRLALSRSIMALGEVRVGYQVPDYSAYEDMLGSQMPRYRPVVIHPPEENGFVTTAEHLERAITDERLDAFLVSNPCNPTGQVVRGDALAAWLDVARRRSTTLLLDEFYSQFIFEPDGPGPGPVSAAAFVDDVNRDPVILFDGLTKGFRYPGWRVGWAVGPRDFVETLVTAGSSIDGGPSRPVQRAALRVLEPERADQETGAVREVFARKRDLLVGRLESMGVRFPKRPDSTFYAFGSIADLPPPLNDAAAFFRRALEARVMVVPGPFFDVNPGRERAADPRFESWLRFSFGPPEPNVELGLDRLEEMIRQA